MSPVYYLFMRFHYTWALMANGSTSIWNDKYYGMTFEDAWQEDKAMISWTVFSTAIMSFCFAFCTYAV